ncbi:helix-turn-helix transcriptional regulator [Streptomyces sp. NPDC050617]|uniref:helix-turn-helix domain-containing protein n=1 Tax=Streptomyces sp. NPDC050617 TaxID=3154628 RepID=UPI00344AD600
MPPRRQPTARQERLGVELRKLREAAGMTAREAAGLLGTNPIQMSQMESGRAGISEERLRRLAAHYACADAELIDALVAMATERGRGWWEEYRGILPPTFLDLAELEHHATFLCDLNIVHIPGVLQTESYARAVFAYNMPELPASELEPRVEHRMRRRVIVSRDTPTEFEAVIHEAALRIRVGDRDVSRDQLKYVLDESERPNVTVRIIPFDVDRFSGASSSMILAGGVVPQLDTVVRDAPHGTAYLDAASQIAGLRALFRKVEEASLDPAKSRDFIHRVMRDM